MAADPQLQAIAEEVCTARHLTLGEEVGAGAFKHTFEVKNSQGESRALKIYRKAGVDARTDREVEAIRRCSHPGIVRFESIEVWKTAKGDCIYSLEEFLAGGTLTDRLLQAPLSASELRNVAAALVDAVGHIAALGLVHRDLKPDNIMFRSPDGPPVIVDFGLVRDLSQISLTKTWLPHGPGTPLYSPPEQLNNDKQLIDWRADQFSLGVVLAMSGFTQHPYYLNGLTPAAVVDRVARREASSLDFVAWAQANGLEPLIRMVAPWPIQRFRTASQLADAWGNGGKK